MVKNMWFKFLYIFSLFPLSRHSTVRFSQMCFENRFVWCASLNQNLLESFSDIYSSSSQAWAQLAWSFYHPLSPTR